MGNAPCRLYRLAATGAAAIMIPTRCSSKHQTERYGNCNVFVTPDIQKQAGNIYRDIDSHAPCCSCLVLSRLNLHMLTLARRRARETPSTRP
ncbi:hypothetical protein CEP53_013877 [Fusarium sp. AF-6]|nr:hypothetical protein CEP53_013877 [Fusarium sp. AF-6]